MSSLLSACILEFFCGLLILTFGCLAFFTADTQLHRHRQTCMAAFLNGPLIVTLAVDGLLFFRHAGKFKGILFIILGLSAMILNSIMVSLGLVTVIHDVQSHYERINFENIPAKDKLYIAAHIALVIFGSMCVLATVVALLRVVKALWCGSEEIRNTTENVPMDDATEIFHIDGKMVYFPH